MRADSICVPRIWPVTLMVFVRFSVGWCTVMAHSPRRCRPDFSARPGLEYRKCLVSNCTQCGWRMRLTDVNTHAMQPAPVRLSTEPTAQMPATIPARTASRDIDCSVVDGFRAENVAGNCCVTDVHRIGCQRSGRYLTSRWHWLRSWSRL